MMPPTQRHIVHVSISKLTAECLPNRCSRLGEARKMWQSRHLTHRCCVLAEPPVMTGVASRRYYAHGFELHGSCPSMHSLTCHWSHQPMLYVTVLCCSIYEPCQQPAACLTQRPLQYSDSSVTLQPLGDSMLVPLQLNLWTFALHTGLH